MYNRWGAKQKKHDVYTSRTLLRPKGEITDVFTAAMQCRRFSAHTYTRCHVRRAQKAKVSHFSNVFFAHYSIFAKTFYTLWFNDTGRGLQRGLGKRRFVASLNYYHFGRSGEERRRLFGWQQRGRRKKRKENNAYNKKSNKATTQYYQFIINYIATQ